MKIKRNLSTTLDTQEPGNQSVSDIQKDEGESAEAATQGANPDKATNTNESTIPDQAAIPDEGANPDKGGTPEEGTTQAKEATPDASIAAQMATQEPFTQSVKESQAPQEPPTQRVGESLLEAESGKFSNLSSFNSRFICKNEY